MTEQVLKLVPREPDHMAAEVLEGLLDQAEKGNLRGVAYIAIYKDGPYTVGTTGQTMSALEAAGALQKLALALLNSI